MLRLGQWLRIMAFSNPPDPPNLKWGMKKLDLFMISDDPWGNVNLSDFNESLVTENLANEMSG